MERWDIYTSDRVRTGRTMLRGGKLSPGDYHLMIHVCIFSSSGNMLIQQRQPFKKGWPNLWDFSAGGCALAGENSRKAAERETLEEIGLKLDLRGISPHMTLYLDHAMNDIYLLERDVDIRTLRLQYEEVRQVRWASQEEICSMVDNETFIPYHKNLIRTLFEGRKGYGWLSTS